MKTKGITFKQFLEQTVDVRSLRQVIQKHHGADVKRDISNTLDVPESAIQIDGVYDNTAKTNRITIYVDILDNDEEFFMRIVAKALKSIIATYYKRPFTIQNARVFDGRDDALAKERPDGAHYFICVDIKAL